MSSSNSPCAACKFLRRKCTQECVFAPYFPPDQPVKFANVHKVFGASNVAKILNELNATQREDAVNSLAYEAEARLRDPVYGCVGLISILQTRLKQVQTDLLIAKQELCTYIGGQSPAMLPCLNPGFIQQYQNMLPSPATVAAMASGGPGMHPNLQQMLTLQGPGNLREAHHQQQQLYEAHERQMVEAAAREQEMLRNLVHQQRVQQQQLQQQHQSTDLMRFNSGFDAAGPSGQPAVNPNGYTQLTGPATMSPSLALGGAYDNNMYQIQQQHHRQPQPEHEQHHQLQHQNHQQPPHEHHQQLQLLPHHLMLQHQPQPQSQPPQQPAAQPHHGDGSEEGGPSC
ncbi:LOB domain-containing protein 36 [Lactuca sativa]|uniref:LOB domain-containing protein 36 n=1 Tax=Lactuca sativa TaxID=4236 RepID=UPI000CBCA7C5|nr:LOB domain-containing protein 36 [Lactuca sativa]XP_023743274.1 LOB domain-containing protein 36 [Lactuca sativa]XP_042757429.1 LOB domain-containing protein 36 [Lactuca sativa]XP_042757430.1 LOB domain-containing protein 36 [Lactuca sativa]